MGECRCFVAVLELGAYTEGSFMQRRSICASMVLACVLATPGVAGEQPLNAALGERYENKILFFRHCYLSDSQEYDSEGRAIKTSADGLWASHGQIQVRKIVLTKNKLQLEGDRVVNRFDGQR